MSCGSLPPVPGLIPISALRKSPSCNNNDLRECTPCAVQKEVMGEQRSRRTGSQPSVDLIDIARRSRGLGATPQAPSGKAERHRKSDNRRRGEHRGGRKRSVSKRRDLASPTPQVAEDEKCVNPRVNPIFVWVRQEDTHIVDVKCEDYDKRNRIVLTKTPQGWRAIPRTETLVPNLKAAALEDEDEVGRHQARKMRRSHKIKRRSAAVQVDDDVQDVDPPTWNVPINVESHLPSHTIQVHRKRSPSPPEQIATTDDAAAANVNTSSNQDYNAQVSAAAAAITECSASKVCDVSPLDNLLAVAELEFNQQIQTEAWCEAAAMKACEDDDDDAVSIEHKIDECNENDPGDLPVITPGDTFDSDEDKDDDCDYNEDDDNNLAMDDILTRLEQSLQSPDALCAELNESIEILKQAEKPSPPPPSVPDDPSLTADLTPDDLTSYHYEDFSQDLPDKEPIEIKPKEDQEQSDLTVGSTTNLPSGDDKPTDLSTSKKVECLTINLPDDDLLPTDLSLPKNKSNNPVSPRPSSRCSETIQSPQPSGLPALPPHSPDVQIKSGAYLESLLSSTSQKISLNSEVTITRQKEPLDFGKCRKSASPTVTCSEEVNSSSEPEPKKPKLDDITLRTILDAQSNQAKDEKSPKKVIPETSRLLELLTSEAAEPDALAQLKQLHADPLVNLPDPMLVPKDKLSQILMTPGKEIPRLLTLRPELRLPEALAFPHLLQDPDILVITLAQLETIIRKQTLALPEKPTKPINTATPVPQAAPPTQPVKKPEGEVTQKEKAAISKHREQTNKAKEMRMNELCNDINLANSNALNQMMWLPYLHQLEVAAMAFGNGADFLKMLSSAFPPYSANQIPDVSQMFPAAVNRFPQPPGFPMQPPNNPFEFPIWHETTPHSTLQRSNQYERQCNKNAYREYMEKMSKTQTSSHKYSSASSASSKSHAYPPSMYQNNPPLHNIRPFMNVPAAYQPPNMRHNLQIPQYNSMMSSSSQKKHSTPQSTTNCDSKSAAFNFYSSRASNNNNNNNNNNNQTQRYSYNQKLGSLANNHKSKAFGPLEVKGLAHEGKKGAGDFGTQPMDLSGAAGGKSRVGGGKQNFCGESVAKSLKFDDIPEVGSTTASIEDMTAHMQESQKHLWHPLFGNQKSSSNPWNWTTVTATGE